jgi:uncharacterized protein YktB (UPF0637 family)
MKFNGFRSADFDVFKVNGLDSRMEEIQNKIRPKLELLGNHFSSVLSSYADEEIFFHVAKHARRTVNPPKDTWVALASDKRGYKKHPHFQIGLFESHLFVWFAVIYESPIKKNFAVTLKQQLSEIQDQIPDNFVWSGDHTKPDVQSHYSLKEDGLLELIERLENVKKAEILCGLNLSRSDSTVSDGDQLLETIENVFKTLMPLYKLAKQSY